jgi:hypothetical protein
MIIEYLECDNCKKRMVSCCGGAAYELTDSCCSGCSDYHKHFCSLECLKAFVEKMQETSREKAKK